LLESRDYLFVRRAGIWVQVGSVSTAEEERVLRHCVEPLTSLLSRDIGEVDAVDVNGAGSRIKDAEECE
jgi:hypothetical protein